jgi:putative hydrolase of the HAD superfamily
MIDDRIRSVSAVTFDAGGTLLEPHPSVGEVYAEVLWSFGLERDPDKLEADFQAAFASVSKNTALLDPNEREKDFWRQVVRRTVEQDPFPHEMFPDVFLTMWDTFSHGTRWRVFDGSQELLHNLRARGYRLGVISNWDRRLHRVLDETGLASFFDPIIVSADIGIEKPDPGIFRAAETVLGHPPESCLHVGDSRHHDLTGALDAGWAGILVRNDGDPIRLPTVGRLSDLDGLLPGPP